MRLITPIILILAATALYIWYINPTYADVRTLRTEEAQYDAALTRSQELIAVRDALLTTYNAFPTRELERLQRMLPDHVDNVRLILDIDNIAAQYGMALQNISIGEAASRGGDIGADTSPTGAITLSFTVRAPYDSFQNFLMDLEDSLRIVDVTELSFATADETGLTGYTVTLRTYWLK
ncbi:type 4a pilus biogenesis protein PilO [Candidatus Wolfebacteria bacterium]|nr:type 4a pilus biogenesis protein PilO [Candidatus Wolfebacteria bacterium]